MLAVSLTAETWQTWKASYKSKLLLLLLIWLCHPSTKLLPSSAPATVPTESQSSTLAPLASIASGHAIPTTLRAGTGAPAHSPVTPRFDRTNRRSVAEVHDLFHRHTEARTAPSQLPALTKTPPLSSPPAPRQSSLPSSDGAQPLPRTDCPIDYRGRPLCPDSMPTPQSLRKRSSELADAAAEFGHWVLTSTWTLVKSIPNLRHKISPFVLFVALMNGLYLIELAALVIEDSIVRITLANPLPPRFEPAKSFSKQWSRAQWRLKAVLSRYWKQLASISVLLALSLGMVVESADLSQAKATWRDVPFVDIVCSGTFEANQSKRSSPLRLVLLVESIHALTSLIAPLKHVLPESIVPAKVPAPLFLYERAPRERVLVETSWLLTGGFEIWSALLAISQYLVTCFSLPTFSPFSITLHVLGIGVRRHVKSINRSLHSLRKTVNALDVVCSAFCVPREHSDPSHADEGWTCTICFESVDKEVDLDVWSMQGKCELPCGHHYHAGCIVHWLHYQAFCPVCHFKLDTSHLRKAPSPRRQQQQRWDHNVYPGNVRRRPVVATQ